MSERRTVPVIGLVGGVGSGKSTLARFAAEHRSWPIVDGDRIGHRLLADETIREAVRQRFGDTVIDTAGAVDRAALAARVFGDSDENRRALADLNAILHPRIRREIEHEIERLRELPDVEAILLDAAVMFEAGWNDRCDAVVFVDSPRSQRLARVRESRGWTEDRLGQREDNQMPLDEKRRAADLVVVNDGTVEEGGRQLIDVVDRVRTGPAD